MQATQAELRGDHAARYDFLKRAAALSPDRRLALASVAIPLMGRPYPWKALTAGLHFLARHEVELDEARQGKELNPGDLRFFEMETTARPPSDVWMRSPMWSRQDSGAESVPCRPANSYSIQATSCCGTAMRWWGWVSYGAPKKHFERK